MERREKEQEIICMELKLGTEFPQSYRQFLLEREKIEEKIGFRLFVFGLMEKEGEMSVLQATEFLWTQRPELREKKLICVRLVKDWAVCLDLRENPQEDCPILNVNRKNKEIPITQTNPSFQAAIEEAIQESKRALIVKQRIENRRKEVERARGREFSHLKGGIQPRARDWHPVLMRIHDAVVARTAFRYNFRWNALEVDEFYAYDHPEYKKGESIRNLTKFVFSWARELGGSLNIIFSRDLREGDSGKIARTAEEAIRKIPREKRNLLVSRGNYPRSLRPIPRELVDLAEEYGISFEKETGRISHQEGVDLFFALFELPEEIKKKVEELERARYLSKEMLCEIITARIWSKEEAIWFFLNVPRPEAIILGTDVPESRLLYSESVHWGRSVYLVSLLQQKILVDLTGGLPEEEREGVDCQLEPREKFWFLKVNQRFYLPWQIKGIETVWVEPEEPMLILSRPQQTSQPDEDKDWLAKNIEFLAKVESEAKIRCLLVSFEFSDLKYGMKISEEMKEISKEAAQKGVYLLFSPYRLDILNDKVEERMNKARRMRQFPARGGPLKFQVIEIPKEVWSEPALRFSVEDALSAASWIIKKIDLRLGRIRFRTNCQVVERIALQDPRNKKIAELEGEESKELLAVLKSEQGITFPFIQPDEMTEFFERIKGKGLGILSKAQGGIVVVVPPFEKLTKLVIERKIEQAERSVPTRVPLGFQFPVDPNQIDFSRYRQGYRKAEIKRFHQQIQTALAPLEETQQEGQPLAVSYLPHELFPEVMRDYIYYTTSIEYQKKPFLYFLKHRKKYERREPPEPVWLRISYHDGTEGEPFPLFCLLEPERVPRPKNLYLMKIGTISMRHANLDLITEGYLITNIMIKRKQNSADQEDYAFRMTWHFLTNFVDLVQHKRVEEITQETRFKYLWNWLKLEEQKYEGCELHIFQTGLEPAVVGIYRAIVEFLKQRRGELVVVPRLISYRNLRELGEEKEIIEKAYIETAKWL